MDQICTCLGRITGGLELMGKLVLDCKSYRMRTFIRILYLNRRNPIDDGVIRGGANHANARQAHLQSVLQNGIAPVLLFTTALHPSRINCQNFLRSHRRQSR